MPRPGLRWEPVAVLRPAGKADADAVHRLSGPFVREGALRDRSAAQYARDAGDFVLAETARGELAGCVALCRRRDAYGGVAAVLYNFCVAPGNQGRGIGSALLRAALAEAAAQGVSQVFTATARQWTALPASRVLGGRRVGGARGVARLAGSGAGLPGSGARPEVSVKGAGRGGADAVRPGPD